MGPGAGPALTPPPPALSEGPQKRRYEFVVMFVWREPGADIKTQGADAAPASTAGGPGLPPMGR